MGIGPSCEKSEQLSVLSRLERLTILSQDVVLKFGVPANVKNGCDVPDSLAGALHDVLDRLENNLRFMEIEASKLTSSSCGIPGVLMDAREVPGIPNLVTQTLYRR
jgi:uncharacterized protein (UPF0212 family)